MQSDLSWLHSRLPHHTARLSICLLPFLCVRVFMWVAGCVYMCACFCVYVCARVCACACVFDLPAALQCSQATRPACMPPAVPCPPFLYSVLAPGLGCVPGLVPCPRPCPLSQALSHALARVPCLGPCPRLCPLSQALAQALFLCGLHPRSAWSAHLRVHTHWCRTLAFPPQLLHPPHCGCSGSQAGTPLPTCTLLFGSPPITTPHKPIHMVAPPACSAAILPAAILQYVWGDRATYKFLLIAQVALALQLPVTLVPMIKVGTSECISAGCAEVWLKRSRSLRPRGSGEVRSFCQEEGIMKYSNIGPSNIGPDQMTCHICCL